MTLKTSEFTCYWCGSVDPTDDCKIRVTCLWAGMDGHHTCGKKTCGCPRFMECKHKGVELFFTPNTVLLEGAPIPVNPPLKIHSKDGKVDEGVKHL